MTSDTSHQDSRRRKVRIGESDFVLSSDDAYLDAIGEHFEPEMCRLFRSLIRPKDRVLDIGANIGCTSLLMGQYAREVHAFEPSPSTFRYLRKNIEAAEFRHVFLHNFGLGDAEALLELTYDPEMRAGGFIAGNVNPGGRHRREFIEIRRGDSHAESLDQIGLIKIDVEGFELKVLEGLKDTLRTHQPTVALEMNAWCLNAFQRMTLPDFLDQILDQFPLVYAVDQNIYVDLRDPIERYAVMYSNFTGQRFQNLVCAFHPDQLVGFYESFYPHPLRENTHLLRSYQDVFMARRDPSNLCQKLLPNGRAQTLSGSGEARVSSLALKDAEGCTLSQIQTGQPVTLAVEIEVHADLDELVFGYMIRDDAGSSVYGTNTFHAHVPIQNLHRGETLNLRLTFKADLGAGIYSMTTALHTGAAHTAKNFDLREPAFFFEVMKPQNQFFVGVAWLPPQISLTRHPP